MQFRFRTLLIVLALGPPMLAAGWRVVRTEGLTELLIDIVPSIGEGLVAMALVGVPVVALAYAAARIAAALTGK